MSHIEIFPKFVQANSEAPPCADLAEIHAIVSRIFHEMKDSFSNEDDMCELTFDQQCALVKELVDSHLLDFQYVFCNTVDQIAKQQTKRIHLACCNAESVVNNILHQLLSDDENIVPDIFRYLGLDKCNISLLITQIATGLTPLFRMVPRLIARFRKQCAFCARIPETVEESLDENWDDSQNALLEENETQLTTLLNRKELVFYNVFCPKNSKAERLDLQIRLIKRLQSRDVDMEVAETSLGKRQDRDESSDGSDGAGFDLGKRLRLQD